MGAFDRKYSDDQRDAVELAGVQLKVRPMRLIAERAERGELELRGQRVPAFQVAESTVRTIVKRAERERDGLAPSDLADLPAADAVDRLRRRLINAADAKLRAAEKTLERRPEQLDCELLRQIARAVREIAAIPGPRGEPAQARPPGALVPGTRANDGGPTRGGLAGEIMRATAPRGIAPAPGDVHPPHELESDTPAAPTSHEHDGYIPAGSSDEPGEYVREQIASGLVSGELRVRPARR